MALFCNHARAALVTKFWGGEGGREGSPVFRQGFHDLGLLSNPVVHVKDALLAARLVACVQLQVQHGKVQLPHHHAARPVTQAQTQLVVLCHADCSHGEPVDLGLQIGQATAERAVRSVSRFLKLWKPRPTTSSTEAQ